jgi:peptide/nickel transport system substrate-binding protein
MSNSLKLVGILVACVLTFGSCGGGKGTMSGPVLRVGWSAEPDSMNPITSFSTQGLEIFQLVYDKLIGYDLDLKPAPELAKEWSYSSDGKTITFKLRGNAAWQDGQPLGVDDVIFTYQLIKEKELGEYAQWLTHMTSVSSPSAGTVALSFDQPQAFNPGLAIPILPKHIWSSMSAEEIQKFANDKPIGSGPYRFVEWKNGASLTLERNPSYWGSAPKAEKIIYVLYGNEDIMAQAIKSGDIDIVTEMPPTIWDGMKEAKNVKLASLPSFSFHHIGFNVSKSAKSKGNPLLRDATVRQALSWAVDRNQLVQLALAGHGVAGDSILPIGIGEWYHKIPDSERMNGDLEKAKKLLDAAGYMDRNGDGLREDAKGRALRFRLIATQTVSVDVRAAGLFKDAAEKVGVKLDLQTLDENTLGNTVYDADAPDWDIFVWGWDSNVPDPNYMLSVPLTSQIGANNDVFYSDAAYDDLFYKQSTTIDSKARKAITDRMQESFYKDAAYIVMWYQEKLQAYRTDTWKGWKECNGGVIYNITRANYLKATPTK